MNNSHLEIESNVSVGLNQGQVIGLHIGKLANVAPGDVPKIAASQIELLTDYYNVVLAQAKMSFRWALAAAGAGLIFFLGAVAFYVTMRANTVATISVVGGALIEVIAGINFYLYGKTSEQLVFFHGRLDQTQRFLLANSICESLEGDAAQQAKSELVRIVATSQLDSRVNNTMQQVG